MSRRRWSDNERNLGPFTFARDKRWRWTALLTTADDDGGRCHLRLEAFGCTLIIWLPPIVPPHRERVIAHTWDAATIERLGRNWYINETRRAFGVQVFDGLFMLRYGMQSDDSRTERSWSWFLPWTQWRHVRQSWYGLEGEHIASQSKYDYAVVREIEAAQPKRRFVFADYDGEVIEATTGIEEREWRFGTGSFRWLSLFRKPKVCRTLDLQFSAEVGKRKGSWKGGTLGHSIEMLPGELHEAAFRRYCAAHSLTFMNAGGGQ